MTFTYSYYLELIHQGMENDTRFFVRHDIDHSIKKALEMAEIEAKYGIVGNYYVLLSSPLYNALDSTNIQRLKMIMELGHGIGLHYDRSIQPDIEKIDVVNEIMVQLGLLDHKLNGIGTHSVTFHKPVMGIAPDDSIIKQLNMNNVYVPDYDIKFKYISDSGHNWREDPFEVVKKHTHVHINTHPIWYNEEYKTMEECFYELGMDKDIEKTVQREIKDIREYLEKIT